MEDRVLNGIEPEGVLRYFEEICRIPHGSGNIEAISRYLAAWAEEKGLRYVREECGNVIVYADATPGYGKEPGIILQGHMDMVAVQDSDCAKDMSAEGLDVFYEGNLIGARGTSLGGDDGIALAYAMAILSDKSIPHPALEAVFTVNEETGMDGAMALNPALLKCRRLLNLDSEDEGIFLAGCAGGATLRIRLPLERKETAGSCYAVTVAGLRGGHSGTEIQKNRANAILLLGRVLRALQSQGIHTVAINGGTKDNAIPTSAVATVRAENRPDVTVLEAELKNVLTGKEDGFSLTVEEVKESAMPLTPDSEQRLLQLLELLPFGVAAMSTLPGLVETSNNVGILHTDNAEAEIAVSVRSLIESEKEALCAKIGTLAKLCGAAVTRHSEYPGWQYRAESPLRAKAIEAFREEYGREPLVETIHAGLECGLLLEKIPDMDALSMGPAIYDIHTTKERLDIASVKRTWSLLLRILAKKDS